MTTFRVIDLYLSTILYKPGAAPPVFKCFVLSGLCGICVFKVMENPVFTILRFPFPINYFVLTIQKPVDFFILCVIYSSCFIEIIPIDDDTFNTLPTVDIEKTAATPHVLNLIISE